MKGGLLHEYNGKQYTKYEALQKQRRMETTMRTQRQKISLLQQGNAKEDEIINARCRYQGTSQEYARFSKAMDLPQQRARVTADGPGNIGVRRTKGGSSKLSPIKPQKVGARVVDKVTKLERDNLLKSVDKSAKSVIIKEREMLPRKVGNEDFSVDWSKVQSKEYSDKFKKLSDDEKVSSAVETRAKWALNNRDGVKTEELYAINMKTGEEVGRITDQNFNSAIKRTPQFEKILKSADLSGDDILLLHNHPLGLPPSISDINALFKNNNARGITVGHNGSVYMYTKPKVIIDEADWNIAMKHFKMYSEQTAIEKSLEVLSKKYGFTVQKL